MMEDKRGEEEKKRMLHLNVPSKMMGGSERESMEEGIFKPQCLFSFRWCVCARIYVRKCVRHQGSLPNVTVSPARTPESSQCGTLTQSTRLFPLHVTAMV